MQSLADPQTFRTAADRSNLKLRDFHPRHPKGAIPPAGEPMSAIPAIVEDTRPFRFPHS